MHLVLRLTGIMLIILLLSSTFTVAQQNANAQINVSASLIKGLNVNYLEGNLDFGEIILNNSQIAQTRSPDQGAVIQVKGHPNKNIIINFNSITLSNSQWVNENGGTISTIEFTPIIKHTFAQNEFSNPNDVQSGNSYPLSNLNGIGTLNIWMGGELRINSAQPQGDYIGNFTITFSY